MSHATDLLRYGLSVVPIAPGSKKPRIPWKQFRTTLPTEQEAAKWDLPIAAVCGKVSGGLMCLDFDAGGEAWGQYQNDLAGYDIELYLSLMWQRTPSGGVHVIFRCPEPLPSQKLASRPPKPGELDKDGATKPKSILLIETRGEGGYFVCAPSPGYTLESGTFESVPEYTMDQVELLLNCARCLDAMPEVKEAAPPIQRASSTEWELTPFDDFDGRNDPIDILQKHGWSIAQDRGNGSLALRRPGKDAPGVSATWNHIPRRFYCFSTNADPFIAGHIYKASAVYALLEHAGDYTKAARELHRLGYGREAPVDWDGASKAAPFDVLGFDGDALVYRRRNDAEILTFDLTKHNKLQLLWLASKEEWDAMFPGNNGPWTDLAQRYLLEASKRAGRFNPRRVRGYGAWPDGGRIVYNDGETVDGVPIAEYKSEFFYSRLPAIDREYTPRRHPELLEVFSRIGMSSRDRILFGGWVVVAPICGALSWRPHIWITSDRGSGKTTLLETVVRPMIEHCVQAKSRTTEAGIRQALRNNAIPVIFDEAEGKSSVRSRDNIDQVIELSRMASDNSGHIQKGTPSGKVIEYTVRSCFCFASIATGTKEGADESRITTIELKKLGVDDWDLLRKTIARVLTRTVCGEHRRYMVHNVDNVLSSIDTIRTAIVNTGQNTRCADQLAPMAAGWWHITHEGPIGIEDAEALVDEIEDEDFIQKAAENELDSYDCLEAILTTVPAINTQIKRSIAAHAVMAARRYDPGSNPDEFNPSHETLLSLGMKVLRDGHLAIHAKNTEFLRMMRDTPYTNARAIQSLLGRIPGVLRNKNAFLGHRAYRCIHIPMHHVSKEAKDE